MKQEERRGRKPDREEKKERTHTHTHTQANAGLKPKSKLKAASVADRISVFIQSFPK